MGETIRISEEVEPFVVNKLRIRLNNDFVDVMDVFKIGKMLYPCYDMKATFGDKSVSCSRVCISDLGSLYKMFETKDKYRLAIEDENIFSTVVAQDCYIRVCDCYYSVDDLFVRRMKAKL